MGRLMTCKFLDANNRCEIGCKSKNICKGELCPFSESWDPDKYLCPCHSDGLSIILAERVGLMIKKLTREGKWKIQDQTSTNIT